MSISKPLQSLEQQRANIANQIADLGDLRCGSITSTTGRCGKPSCHCHQPNDPGHGPNLRLTYKVEGKTATESLPDQAAMRKAVRTHIARIMSDIAAAEKRGDVVDGVPVGQSSNPYDYVGVSPAFTKLVALGKPALPAIVAEIEASDQNGLREYLLAAAGAQIDGDTPGSGAQTWSTGKEWARQYREDH